MDFCRFEEFMKPFLEDLNEEQVTQGTRWTPSKFINRLGKAIANESSVYYWAWKVRISSCGVLEL
jgi:deoxyhypusine synthase